MAIKHMKMKQSGIYQQDVMPLTKRRAMTNNTGTLKMQSIASLLGLLILGIGCFSPAQAVDVTAKEWDLAIPIMPNGTHWINPEDQEVVVLIGGEIECEVDAGQDDDHWVKRKIADNSIDSEGHEDDTLHYEWQEDPPGETYGTFDDPTNPSTSWKAPNEPGTYVLTCVIDDEPIPVDPPESGDTDDVAASASITVHVVKVEMTSPSPTGDPTSDAGENEYVFGDYAAGMMFISGQASLTPDNPATQEWAKDNISWEFPSITGSAKAFYDPNAPNNQGDGKGASVSCNYTGLPVNNSDFGAKTVKMNVTGGDSSTANIEVFFKLQGSDHPDLAMHPMAGQVFTNLNIVWPNWAYYYLQAAEPQLLGNNPEFEFYPTNGAAFYAPLNGGGLGTGGRTAIHKWALGPNTPTYGPTLAGIDAFVNAVVHETQHYVDWVAWWGNDALIWNAHNGLSGGDDDKDGDRLPNKFEDENLNGVKDAGERYDWQNPSTFPVGPENTDSEDWTRWRSKAIVGDHTQDWASPGMQRNTNGKWDD